MVGPTQTRNEGIIGEGIDLNLVHTGDLRASTLVYNLTKRLLETKWRDPNQDLKIHLFGKLSSVVKQWLDTCLVCRGGTYPAQLMYQSLADMACNRITAAITSSRGERSIKALLDSYNPTGSTRHVNFTTSKTGLWTTDSRRCHVNLAVLDSDWEAEFCRAVESHPSVLAYVKNHNLGLEVPYLYGLHAAHLRPRLHRAGGRRPSRPAEPDYRNQGLPGRGREGEEQCHDRLLAARRQRLGRLRPLGLRRAYRCV